jgi:polysaccharide deacetylase 2 family uncharacterized protein YibQ
MASEDLNRPLGLPPEAQPSRRRFYLLTGGGSIAAVAVVALGAWLLVPVNRGPTATAVINTPPAGTSQIAPDRTGSIIPPPPGGLTEVMPSGNLTDVGKVVITDPSAPLPIQLASLPRDDLIEKTADGLLPRIGNDGTRPLDAYARPSDSSAGDTRIAIVIGGMGIDADGTTRAIQSLPGQITLAFAPYGAGLPKLAADARTSGHELLLQIPLEPFNYPATNPGQNTLTADATPAVNLDRLHWLLGRITNYVGVINYMGARFTGEADALKPVIDEIGGRGLLYLDDGSSARSKAGELAGSTTPYLRADVVLDADLSPAAINARLAQLLAIAKERGYAIATGTAFPATIEQVAAFARTAAAKGITLVPVSALAAGKS